MTAKTALKTYSAEEATAILDAAMNQSQGSAYAALEKALLTRISVIEEVLPAQMRGQAARLVKRAMFTFSRSDKLVRCTPVSFVRCVLEAAEVGLAIDGKLGHAVPYGSEAQFQPDYKGLIAIAKRANQIRDAYGDVVCKNDHFKHGRSGGQSVLEHSYDLTAARGDVIGAYAIIKLADDWRSEVMTEPELARIRNKSKAKNSGPWVTDTDQMRIKTVIKRALKLYCDDPGLIRALEFDDREYEGSASAIPQGRVQRSALNDVLALPKSNGEEPSHAEDIDQTEPDDPIDLALTRFMAQLTVAKTSDDLDRLSIDIDASSESGDIDAASAAVMRAKLQEARDKLRGGPRGERSNQKTIGAAT